MKKKAGAPLGNTNRLKWTHRKVARLFTKMLKMADEKELVKVGKDRPEVEAYRYDFIGEILRELKLNKDILAHFMDLYPDLEPRKVQLKTVMEANCYHNTKKGLIREATGLVNLKSNHNWTDRSQVEASVVNVPVLKNDPLG